MIPVSVDNALELRGWHVVLLLVIAPLAPLFRAVAVVLIAKFVNNDIAKLAIPLVLKPMRPSIFPSKAVGPTDPRSVVQLLPETNASSRDVERKEKPPTG